MNCSQPMQPAAFGDPAQAVLPVKKSLLIWSVYVSAIDAPAFAMRPVSPVTLVTFSKWPIVWVMCPDGACADTSLLFPTTAGRGPCRGPAGMFGAFTHGTSFHSVLGYAALKHPFFGAALRSMESLHSLRLFCSSGDTCPSAAAAVLGGPLG